ncbi:MAG TPA: TolC family protein, partial [Planctomycetaceae bacterium]|nr:TolC family protein [Planctomycetaceae bacterium]
FGQAFNVENPNWLENLLADVGENEFVMQTSIAGVVNQPAALHNLELGQLIELANIHNREYQTEIENVYLQALAVSRERFQFGVRYLGRGGTPGSSITGTSVPGVTDSLSQRSNFGVSQLLPTGAQWLVELTNNTLWIFSGGNNTTASTISYSLVQPLLRNAGRKVVLENLTQTERDLLYAVRDLARFRKIFFTGIVTGSGGFGPGYLGLLQQHQELANSIGNIKRTERQIEIQTELSSRGLAEEQLQGGVFIQAVAQLQSRLLRDRNSLRSAERALQDSYDTYKISLGLPPDLTISINLGLLEQFELIAPDLLAYENSLYDFMKETWGVLMVPDEITGAEPPADEEYRKRIPQFRELYLKLLEHGVSAVEQDFAQLDSVLEIRLRDASPEERQKLQSDIARDRRLFQESRELLELQRIEIENLTSYVSKSEPLSRKDKETIYLSGLSIRQKLLRITQSLEVVQVNQRVEKVLLQPFEMSLEEVTKIALETRLDLMNAQAAVTDARRAVEIAANALEAAIQIRVDGDVSTRPGKFNPVDFRGANSSFRAGLEFDTPLDQIDERNAYRAALINYQRAKRTYMQTEDSIKAQVRQTWRQLQVQKANFATSRQSVRFAAIQLDTSVEESSNPAGGGRGGFDLLNALETVLQSQNAFIRDWISYEESRINIYRDMEIMEIAPDGVWEDNFYRTLSSPGGVRLLQDLSSPEMSPSPDSAEYLPIPGESGVKFSASRADQPFSATQTGDLSVSYLRESQFDWEGGSASAAPRAVSPTPPPSEHYGYTPLPLISPAEHFEVSRHGVEQSIPTARSFYDTGEGSRLPVVRPRHLTK